jgi:hypothetical protein
MVDDVFEARLRRSRAVKGFFYEFFGLLFPDNTLPCFFFIPGSAPFLAHTEARARMTMRVQIY